MNCSHDAVRFLGMALLAMWAVPPRLAAQTATSLRAEPSSITLNAQAGGPPPQQTLNLTSSGASLSFQVSVTTASGGDWLFVGPVLAGGTPATLVVGVNPSPIVGPAASAPSLPPPGTYSGSIRVTAAGASNSPVTIPVTLNVSGGGGQLTASTSSLAFQFQTGAAAPPAQTVQVSASGGGTPSFTTTIATEGGNWLSVNPSSGKLPATLSIAVTPAALSAGSYSGFVAVNAPEVSPNPLSIRVTLTVTAGQNAASLRAEPSSFTLRMQQGAAPPQPQTLALTSTGAVLSFRVTVTTSSGGDWLFVGPVLAGSTPASLVVGLNPSPIVGPGASATPPPGTYMGSIRVTAESATNSPVVIPVTLIVTSAPAQLSASPTSMAFEYRMGASAPPSQTVQISASGGATPSFTTSVASDGGNWLSAAPASGRIPASLTVNVNPAGLTPGAYSGVLAVVPTDASAGPLSIRVSLTVSPAPPSVSGVMNGASFAAGAVAPGEIVAIFGSALGPTAPASASANASGQLESTLAGARVWFDDVAAPLLYASGTQLTAIAPYDIRGRSSVRLQVEAQGTRSAAVELRIAESAPAIFTMNATGSGPGAVLNQDYSVNSASNPARRGSIVVIYATGEGQTDPAGVNGLITGASLRRPIQPVSVSIGGERAELLYAGSAPGLACGVLQVNARVPEGIAAGTAVPVLLTVGQSTSQTGVVVAVN